VTSSPDRLTASAPDTPRLRLVLILGALIALGPLTIDMYLPSLPTIATELAVPSATIQLTLTGTLLGLGVGQLVVGPLSDALGRKVPLLAGTALHVLASLTCLVAPNIVVLGGARLLQGLGAAAGAVIAMAVVRDLYTGRPAAVLISRLILVMGAAPIVAPTLGSALLAFTSWRGVFAALALIGLALIPITARLLPETLPVERRQTAGVRGTIRNYGRLLHDRTFVGLALVAGLTMTGLFAYVAGASFVMQQEFGLGQQQFALLFSSGAIFLIAATQLNPVLLRWLEPRQVLVGGVVTAAVAAGLMLALAVGGAGLFGLLLPLWLTLFAAGFALPNAPAVALGRYGDNAGTAAALLGAVQFGTGAVISPMVGVLGNDSVAMATVIAAGLALSLVVLIVVVRPWQLTDDDVEADDVAAVPA
jgi:DHA1 family bicyclomycin/chloramphenicol resistance-like MFS transporter